MSRYVSPLGAIRTVGRVCGPVILGRTRLFVLAALLSIPVAYALGYVALWEGLINHLVSGTKWLSVEDWSLGIANSIAHNGNLKANLTATPSIVMCVIAAVLLIMYATERLSAFTVRAD